MLRCTGSCRRAGRTASVLILIGTLSLGSCADNATRLGYRVGREIDRLGVDGEDLEIAVPYRPVRDNGLPYWLVFSPGWRFRVTDLVDAGLDEVVAERLFRELGYVGFGEEGRVRLAVVQEGRRTNFTSAVRAWPDRLLVEKRQGPCEILLERHAGAWRIVGVR